MNDFIKKMLEYGAELDQATGSVQISMIINDAEILYKNHLAELNLLNIPVVIDCSTCKHNAVSKYVEPCHGCRDNDSYDNYESAIIL